MSQITVSLIDHMGDDLTVANAARVSFGKRVDHFRDQDARLIAFLAKNGHFTPFTHPQITVHVRAPIFVRAQCYKSKVGFTENEISRRYVDDQPAFYRPARWRGRAADKKQGSSNVDVAIIALDGQNRATPGLLVEDLYRTALETYAALIDGGVAPEQARMVLPQSMMTEWWWTGSLAAFARFCNLRLAPDAQAETGEVAGLCSALIGPLFPVSWSNLTGEAVELDWRGGDAA